MPLGSTDDMVNFVDELMKSLLRKFVPNKERTQALEALRQTCESFGDKGLRLFDEVYYRKSNPDVARRVKDAFAHFMTAGWREGRNPSRYFDVAWYLEQNPDVRAAGANPLVHYIEHGHTEKRPPSDPDRLDALIAIAPHFDDAYYLASYPDVAASGADALLHYVSEGWREARNPSPDFDSAYYLQSYLDVRRSGLNPFAHYIRIGRTKGYLPKPGADVAIRKMPLARNIPLDELPSEIVQADALAGGVDMVSLESGRISGWVADRANPETTLIVRVECDGEIVAAFAADLFRADLKEAGINNPRHGFVWKVPADICDDRPHRLILRAGGGMLQLPPPYQRSVRFPPAVEAAGNVDSVSSSAVRGWACDIRNPDDSVEVEILIDGELAGKVTADMERADVRAAGFGHGNYGFSWDIPERFKDGRRHVVTCRVGSQLLPMPDNGGQGALFSVTASFLFGGRPPKAFNYLRPAANGLPDSFTVKATGPTSKTLVVALVRNAAEWRAFDHCMASLKLTDCNVYAAVTSTDFLDALIADFNVCPNVFLAQYAASLDNGRICLHVLNSGILTDYESVYLFNFAESAADWPDLLMKPANYERWGLVVQSVTSAAVVMPEEMQAFLENTLVRLGSHSNLAFRMPQGGALWLNAVVLRHVAALGLNPKELTPKEQGADEDIGRDTAWRRLLALFGYFAAEGRLAVLDAAAFEASAAGVIEGEVLPPERRIKAIAFLLPQFHPVPENDRWWGRGFTEWNNVIRARPLFRSHYQPRLPRDLGFYDLRQPETQAHQARLAQDHGVFGFCYYYYWFDGKKMLNAPIEQMLSSGQPDHPFCVCWANENWSRNWDGQERHVLLKQNYSLESNRELIREFITMMKDRRYIRHNGRPVLVVYRIRVIPNWLETAAMWRQECREAGIGEIHLCAVRFGLEPLDGPPEEFGVDSYVMFPPHETVREDIRGEVRHLHGDFKGEIFSYDAVWQGDLARFEEGYPWPVHRGVMMGWDNTARRLKDARIFHGATPLKFRAWLDGIVAQEDQHNPERESLLFINAWNEWAEGTTLEPDIRFADSYLRAVRSVLGERVAPWQKKSGDAPALTAPARLKSKVVTPTTQATPLNTPVRHEGKAEAKAGKPTILLCAHISGHMLFGGERSFLDIITTLHGLGYNLVVCLPSGNNKDYIEDISQYAEAIYVFRYPQWHSRREIDQYLLLNFSDIIAAHDISLVYANTIVLLEPLIAAKRMNRLRLIHARELVSLDAPLQEHMQMTAEEAVSDVFARSDFVIGNSRATYNLFARHDRTFYVPNAVKVEDFAMDNIVGEKIRFGIVSSNIPKKGVADFIEVARYCAGRTDKAEFVVIGPENDYISALKQETNLPGNLTFAGYSDTPAGAMQSINVLLSLSNFAESFGRTVTEAMAAGRPVIAYEWGAVPELINHGETGYLVPYRDPEAAARAVLDLCAAPDRIVEMGTRGRAAVTRNYSYDVMKQNLKRAMTTIFSKATLKRLGLPALSIKPMARGVTVVIPVYNAFDEVDACLESVLKHTRCEVARVLVIDDGSTDERIRGLLAGYENRPGVTVVYNDANMGYTRTVNKGIGLAGTDDVILLNSDALVTPNWLAGLRAAAFANDHTGTVTAMSDNAGAFSFPEQDQANATPGYLSKDDFAIRVVQAAGRCQPVEVPTGSGFCMYIRRALLDEIGLFDEIAFSRGYGEENDLCMRAVKAGWKNVITPWSYVYHVRTASFKGEKAELVRQGVAVVTQRYPDYAAQVKSAFTSAPMARLRAATKSAG